MEIPASLTQASVLTDPQLESLMSYLRVRSGEATLKEAASSRRSKPVTVGSYYRTVQQAEENLRKSVVTVVIGLWLGVVRREDLQRLFTTVGPEWGKLEGEGAERAAGVVLAMIDQLVTVK